MNDIFPCYTTSFPCDYTVQEVTRRISATAVCQHNDIEVVEADHADAQKVVLTAHTGGCVYHNSFMPMVTIKMMEVDGKAQVSMFFELQKSTKIFMKLFTTIALLFGL